MKWISSLYKYHIWKLVIPANISKAFLRPQKHKARHLIMPRLMFYLRALAPISNFLSLLSEHNRKSVACEMRHYGKMVNTYLSSG